MFKRAFFVMPAFCFGLVALVGCSTVTPVAAPTPSSASVEKPQAVVEKPECAVNPADVPVPPADPYTTLPAKYGVQVKIAGAPGVVKVGEQVEVEVTLCNNSPVAYPEVSVVFGLSRCSCARDPLYISQGSAQWFDGDGGIVAVAVTTDGPMRISEASAPFAVRH